MQATRAKTRAYVCDQFEAMLNGHFSDYI